MAASESKASSSIKDLSDLDLQRVLRAVRHDSAKLEGIAKTKSPKRRR